MFAGRQWWRDTEVESLSTLWFCRRVVRLLKIVGADTFATWAAPKLEVAYAQVSGERMLQASRLAWSNSYKGICRQFIMYPQLLMCIVESSLSPA
jgi:hypothetical protein